MTQKLSPHKVSKMMVLYFDGYSQSDIANKLKVNQSTVSLYVSKFKSLAEQQGIKAAGEEFGIMDQVEALNSLASELKKAKLTVEEAKVGLKMAWTLQKLGIKQEDYNDVIQTCTKMKSEGFIGDAVKLSKLENATGMTHGQLLAQYASTHEKLEKEQQELETTTGQLNSVKEELASMDKQKKAANQALKAYMDQIGVDMNRLKLVEGLAQVLKEAGISDKDLQEYIARQQVLSKAGISLDVFTAIVGESKVLTSHDQGKGLLKSLADYGGINEAIKDSKAKIALLEKQAVGLEQVAEQKGKLIAEITELKAEKATLESVVAELHVRKEELDHVKSELASLTNKRTQLEKEIVDGEEHDNALAGEIKAKQQKVSDLSKLEAKRDALAISVSETEAKLNRESTRLQIFESFLGFVNSSSIAELEKFVAVLPALIDKVKKNQYSPQLLRAYIFKTLTGHNLQIFKCPSCGVRFSVDMPPMTQEYCCPRCGSYHTVTDQEGLQILKEVLTKMKPIVVVPLKEPDTGSGAKSGG